jgi:hypothetical protein
MKRVFLGATLALVVGLMISSLAWADFGLSNFRMSDRPGGPKMTRFPQASRPST